MLSVDKRFVEVNRVSDLARQNQSVRNLGRWILLRAVLVGWLALPFFITWTFPEASGAEHLPSTVSYAMMRRVFENLGIYVGLTILTIAIMVASLGLYGLKRLRSLPAEPPAKRIGRRLERFFPWFCLVMAAAFLYGPGNDTTAQLQIDLPWMAPRIAQAFFAGAFPSLFNVVLALLGVTYLVVPSILIGSVAIRLIDRRPLGWLPLLVTSFLIGQTVLYGPLLWLSAVGQFRPAYLTSVLVICTVIGFAFTPIHFDNPPTGRALLAKMWREESRFWRATFVLLATLILVTLLQSWIRMDGDSASFVFLNAKLTAMDGAFRYMNAAYVVVSNYHAELQFAALSVLFNDRVARILGWVMALIIASFALLIGREVRLKRHGLLLLVAMLYTSTAFTDLIGSGKIDLFGFAFALAAVYWLTRIHTDHQRLALICVGLFSGFAVFGKPTYALALGPMVLFYIIWSHVQQKQPLWVGVRQLLLAGLFALVPALIFVARNWVLLGEPLAPIYYFDADSFSAISRIRLDTWVGLPLQRWAKLTFPILATTGPVLTTLGALSPLWLIFMFLWFRYRQIKWHPLLICGVANTAIWLVFSPFVIELRYAMNLWVILFIPAVQLAIHTLQHAPSQIQAILKSSVILLLGFMILRTLYIAGVTPDHPVGSNEPVCSVLVPCQTIEAVNEMADEGDRVLLLSRYGYYLRPDLQRDISSPSDMFSLNRSAATSPEAFWRDVQSRGFEYIAYEVFFNQLRNEFELSDLVETAPDWVQLTPIYSNTTDVAYRIEFEDT